METDTKIMIAVGAVAAVGIYWWYTHRSVGALGGGVGPGPGSVLPSGGPVSTTSPVTTSPFGAGPSAGGAQNVMAYSTMAESFSQPGLVQAVNSVPGPHGGVITWGTGVLYDPSTGILTNVSGANQTISLPTFDGAGSPDGGSAPLVLTPSMPRYNVLTGDIS
jgi:hypothetical protein